MFEQLAHIKGLIKEFLELFRDTPGLTILVVHDVETGDAAPIKQHLYRLSPHEINKAGNFQYGGNWCY